MFFTLRNNCKIDFTDGVLAIVKQEFEIQNEYFDGRLDQNLIDKTEINAIYTAKEQIKTIVKKAQKENNPGDLSHVKHEIKLISEPIMQRI